CLTTIRDSQATDVVRTAAYADLVQRPSVIALEPPNRAVGCGTGRSTFLIDIAGAFCRGRRVATGAWVAAACPRTFSACARSLTARAGGTATRARHVAITVASVAITVSVGVVQVATATRGHR